ncbi:SusC/RagA family TonB-linked outer membrane protein [Tenacibaculum sp. TC6]|uniref:SusC/RagA family TonB-linked outer membrane protein n=1 Tax=Tenacibaculum sp. TC6 TaxID=3423223 RepID=UPI003D35E170
MKKSPKKLLYNTKKLPLNKSLAMKLTLFLFLFSILQVLAIDTYSQNKITINIKDTPLSNALHIVEQQTNLLFVYNHKTIGSFKVSANFKNKPLNTVLEKLLKNKEISYKKVNNHLVFYTADDDINHILKNLNKSLTNSINSNLESTSITTSLQDKNIYGKVIDEFGEPIPDVTVRIKNTKRFTYTDVDGNFVITIKNKENTLLFTYIGFEDKEVIISNQNNITVLLKEASNVLNNVNVTANTGYQEINREQATGAYSVVTAKTLDRRISPTNNLLTEIEGQLPGVQLNLDHQNPNRAILIRGVSSLLGSNRPLVVLDGFPMDSFDLSSLNANHVESITVLKDAGAASIYGKRASNGVIVITTKKGKKGKDKFTYQSSFSITPRPNFNYLNYANTQTHIDLQKIDLDAFIQEMAGFGITDESTVRFYAGFTFNTPVDDLILDERYGAISSSTLKTELDRYSKIDNTKQFEELFYRNEYATQHDFSLSGGNDTSNYLASFNYLKSDGNTIGNNNEVYRFTLNGNKKFSEKFNFSYGANYLRAKRNFLDVNLSTLTSIRPYELFADDNGKALAIEGLEFTNEEINRDGAIPDEFLDQLSDLTFKPLEEVHQKTNTANNNNFRVQANLNYKLNDNLNFDIGAVYEKGSTKQSNYFSKDSYYMRLYFNTFAEYNPSTNNLTFHIPNTGGRLTETILDNEHFTGRLKTNYNYSLDKKGKHLISGIFGLDVREIKSDFNRNTVFGYNPETNTNALTDFKTLFSEGISASAMLPSYFLQGGLNFGGASSYRIGDIRTPGQFFSRSSAIIREIGLYANMAYSFDKKYNITANIRIDNDNVVSHSPKFKNKPIWHVGGSWNIHNEDFFKSSWINNLKLRYTYGLTANASPLGSGTGLFITGSRSLLNPDNGKPTFDILNPINSSLQLEFTKNHNFGVDFSLFNNRINTTFDVYNKKTERLFGNSRIDPTKGFNNILNNTAQITNKGFELSLNTKNIKTHNFGWATNVIYSYNKNNVDKVENVEIGGGFEFLHVEGLLDGTIPVEGYPVDALFSYEFAGLDPNDGYILVKDQGGNDFKLYGYAPGVYGNQNPDYDANALNRNALKYSGTILPSYQGSITNYFSYKNFDLSFMFYFQGGNHFRGEYANRGGRIRVNKQLENAWRQPGDENSTNITSVYNRDAINISSGTLSDINIQKADFIKLREVILTYNLTGDFLDNSPFTGIKFTLQGRNLWYAAANTIGVDPEAFTTQTSGAGSRTLPVEPTYTFGINLNF